MTAGARTLATLTLLALSSQLVGCSRDAGAEGPAASAEDPTDRTAPVVVELFTSQGCSSCPPADRLLAELAADPGLAGRIVPLSFHVDYWNDLGWSDPFSSPSWSARQRDYARAFESNRVYTPQVVVDGREAVVGSDEAAVRQQLRRALRRPKAAEIGLELAAGSGAGVSGRATIVALDPARSTASLTLTVVLFESGLDTRVARGENRGRDLRNDVVVRSLHTGAPDAVAFRFPLDPAWRRDRLGVAAFAQAADTMEILGAAVRRSLSAAPAP